VTSPTASMSNMVNEQLSDLHLIQYIPISRSNHSIVSIEQQECQQKDRITGHKGRENDVQETTVHLFFNGEAMVVI